MRHKRAVSTLIAFCAIFAIGERIIAEQVTATDEEARAASKGGATVPLSTYTISPTKVKEKRPLTGTLVGGNPFSNPPTGSTINAVMVPIIFDIGGVMFDPTAPNNCGVEGGESAVLRFNASPLVQPISTLTLNGVNVGNAQYVDGVMRAEFWNQTGGNPAYANPISWVTAPAITMNPGTSGITTGSGCSLLGVVSESFINSQLQLQLQAMTQSGLISPSKLVFFLMNNVDGSSSNPPTLPPIGSFLGFHSATGNPPQFYALMDYDTTGTFKARDISVASHEIAELMNDPLVSNQTPPWGGIGALQSGQCQGNFEVGDPLVGTQMAITLNGYTYHPQELVFFSWFFNALGTPSLGAGGLFSANGTFTGPSKVCPPGGTY